MGIHRIAGALGIGVFIWPLVVLAAGPAVDGDWASASKGEIPPAAIALGREADGRPQFACRVTYAKGVHLGRISAGSSGCNIGYSGRELTLPSYEVLVARGTTLAVRPQVGTMAKPGVLSQEKAILKGPVLAAVPPAAGNDGPVRRGFDEKGQPFVEERRPDGTIVRYTLNGIQITKPDGTGQFIPRQKTYAHAQPPTPPELPADPSRGRNWIKLHNEALLSLISALVRGDKSEMSKFSAVEATQTGGDMFKQIEYRTQIAAFLAEDR
jgi:hypothetical protein